MNEAGILRTKDNYMFSTSVPCILWIIFEHCLYCFPMVAMSLKRVHAVITHFLIVVDPFRPETFSFTVRADHFWRTSFPPFSLGSNYLATNVLEHLDDTDHP